MWKSKWRGGHVVSSELKLLILIITKMAKMVEW